MKLSAFIAGAFGTVGFGVSVLAGIGASNTVESILTRGLVSSGVCYVVGYVVGMMAQQVSLEHAARVAKMVAQQDAKDEQVQAEEAARRDAEAVAAGGNGVGRASATPSGNAG